MYKIKYGAVNGLSLDAIMQKGVPQRLVVIYRGPPHKSESWTYFKVTKSSWRRLQKIQNKIAMR